MNTVLAMFYAKGIKLRYLSLLRIIFSSSGSLVLKMLEDKFFPTNA